MNFGRAFLPRKSLLSFIGWLWLLASFAGGDATLPNDTTTNDSATPMSVGDVARLQAVIDAKISPNGDWIAYRRAVPRDPLEDSDGRSWVELHVVDREGHSRPYIAGEVNIGSMEWSKDGKRIYYLARRDDDATVSLYFIPIDGGESQRVVTHATSIGRFALSADGEQLAFAAKEAVSEEAKELETQGFTQEIYEEDWQATRLWISPLSGDGEVRMLSISGSVHDFGWNPVRRELFVSTSPTPSVDDSYMFKRIQIVDASTGHVLQSVPNPGKLGQVTWSPSGSRLAMISALDINDPREGRLMVLDVPGSGELVELLPEYEAHVSSLAWQNENTLVWIADERQHTTLGQVKITDDGAAGDRKVLREGAGPILNSLSLAADGNDASILGNTSEHPSEVYRFNVNASKPKLARLTTSNPWLAQRRFAEQSVVRWKGSDELDLEGVLVKPLGYVAGRRYPMIMVVHGGPESHVSDGWVTGYSSPGQLGAARGFVVFYPNYRGSTGRGVAFSKLGQEDAAGKEFDDLVAGVDHLVELGLVDRDRVGITGGSYGGYASAWGATYYSERFAASVMFVGISNNVSKVGTTDIPEEMYLVHHRKRLWDDWEYFLERSPIRYVERNETPTLILHGKEDPRVHPSQSLELFRHLKTLGQAPVRLVLYPGEGHGNRRAASRLDYQLRLLRWMERYLVGEGGQAPAMKIDYEAMLSR